MNDRIKLAEAMGWTHDIDDLWKPPHANWSERLPDPENDANDCNALIKHLNGLGWEIHVMWPSVERTNLKHHVKFYSYPKASQNWRGDNWMHGVCELALKVLK